MVHSDEAITRAVRSAYGARALQVLAGGGDDVCCADSCWGSSAPREEQMPATAVSYGCGDPIALGDVRPGETALDLGSGAGRDCLLAAREVGPEGRVIGIDMTPEMITLARANAAKLAVTNVEFRLGRIEALPVEPESVDVILSNCVINLSPDKEAVFREAFRVLRPGGRLQVADVVLNRDLAPEEQEDLEKWAGCVAGALHREDYERRLHDAGFEEIEIAAPDEAPWVSAHIRAHRPAR